MKVLYVCGYRNLIDGLKDRHDLTLYAASPDMPPTTTSAGPFQACFPYRLGSKLDFVSTMQLRQAIRSCRPDLVHAFYSRALAHTILATYGMREPPRIVSFRGIDGRASPISDPSNLITYLHPRVSGHACESAAVKHSLVSSGVSASKCVTTYGCITPPPIDGSGRDRLRAFGIPGDAFVVGTVANMRRIKGVDILLRAAIECSSFTNVYWLLIGRVRDRLIGRLAGDRRIRDRVVLTGYRRDAVRLISGADLFVMPSRSEALCYALLEAMAVGVCPIVSDAGGMKEAVRHNVDGLVTPATDVAALSAAIRRLYARRDLLAQFGRSARQRVREFFSPQQMAERTLSLYRKVLGGENRGPRVARSA